MSFQQKLNKELDNIDRIAYDLQSLAVNFGNTGNFHMEKVLWNIGVDLLASTKKIQTANSEDITLQLHNAQRHTGEMFVTILGKLVDDAQNT